MHPLRIRSRVFRPRFELRISNRCNQYKVGSGNERQGWQERLVDRLDHQVSKHHKHRSPSKPCHRGRERLAVVAFSKQRLQVVQRTRYTTELPSTRRRSDHAVHFTVERDQPKLVALSGGHRGKRKYCVHRMFDSRHIGDSTSHNPAIVEQADHPLIFLGPKGLDDRSPSASGCPPIDLAVFVVGAVFAELIELGSRPKSPCRSQANLGDSRSVDPKIGFVAGAKWRQDSKKRLQRSGTLPSAKPQRSLDSDHKIFDLKVPASSRHEVSAHVRLLSWPQRDASASSLGPQRWCEFVTKLDGAPNGPRIAYRPRDVAPNIESDRPWNFSFNLDAIWVSCEQAVEHCERQQGCV